MGGLAPRSAGSAGILGICDPTVWFTPVWLVQQEKMERTAVIPMRKEASVCYFWRRQPGRRLFHHKQIEDMKNVLMTTWALLWGCIGMAGQTAAPDRLTPEKMWGMGRVNLQDISPDRQEIVYGITRYDLEANRGSSDLYIMRLEGKGGGQPVQLTALEGSEHDAQYRPDGRKIGFLHQGRLWEVDPAAGAKPAPVSEQAMGGFRYSPDGRRILFIRDVRYDKRMEDRHPDLSKANAQVFDGLLYRHWDEWEDGSYSNIFVTGYTDGKLEGEPVNIMGEPYDSPLKPFGGMEQISWHPSGDRIAYTCKKQRGTAAATSTNSDIYLYDILSRRTINLTEGMEGYDMNPSFSPDGRYLIWESMATPGYESDRHRIFRYDLETRVRQELTEGFDRNAIEPVWSADGRRIYFESEVEGTVQLHYLEAGQAGSAPVQLSEGAYNYGPFLEAASSLISVRCSMTEPHELYRIPKAGGTAEQLTHVNTEVLAGIRSARVERRMIRTTDGKDMLTWVVYPPDFDPSRRYPTLLYCQGGPQSTVSQFWSTRWNLSLMAANDYIVVAPNRRGLPSFGQEWNDRIAGDWGGQAMRDLLAAIDDVSREPYVDRNRLGAVGASFGGYSVYWLAGNHDKRFKAFISHCGLFNLESWYGTTEELFFANHDLEGPYWQERLPETWQLDSPHRYVGKWDTPMLVIHGGKDFRVPESEGMQAFQAAQLRGIPSRFLYFPEEGHWVSSPQNGLVWQREFFGWLARWLGPKP
jgi:dipeptidyl aminopeptidase/acylaminoacyl peptidase